MAARCGSAPMSSRLYIRCTGMSAFSKAASHSSVVRRLPYTSRITRATSLRLVSRPVRGTLHSFSPPANRGHLGLADLQSGSPRGESHLYPNAAPTSHPRSKSVVRRARRASSNRTSSVGASSSKPASAVCSSIRIIASRAGVVCEPASTPTIECRLEPWCSPILPAMRPLICASPLSRGHLD